MLLLLLCCCVACCSSQLGSSSTITLDSKANLVINASSVRNLSLHGDHVFINGVDVDAMFRSFNDTLEQLQTQYSTAIASLTSQMNVLNSSLQIEKSRALQAETLLNASIFEEVVVFITPNVSDIWCTQTWTTVVAGPRQERFCRRNGVSSGCYTLNLPQPTQLYSEVFGYVELFQVGSTDGFATTESLAFGDGLSIWSGSNLVWNYVIGLSTSPITADSVGNANNCPSHGGPLPQPNANLGDRWSCASGNNRTAYDVTRLYDVPLFGPTQPFRVTVPLTTSPIQLRFCSNGPSDTDEDIYLRSAKISVKKL